MVDTLAAPATKTETTTTHQVVKRIERALKFSTFEGMAFGAVQGAGEHFIAAYAVVLGASNTQLGLLGSIPSFLGALAQSSSARLVPVLGNRKRVVLVFAALNGVLWLPILAVGYMFPGNLSLWLIAFVALYAAFNALVAPAWGSIMAEVVPDRVRGRYFGLRSRWSTLAHMLTFLLAGGLLYLFKDHGLMGFAIVFGMAFAFRMVSLTLLAALFELPHNPKDEARVGVTAFLKQLPTTNLGRAILYLFAINFVANLAGPFFVPYVLRDLHMDFLTFTALEVVSIVATLLAVTHWGAAADRTGNRRMLLISGMLIGLVPLLWLVSSNVFYLGFAQLFAGFAWAGFNLVSINYIYDATNSHNRTAYLAYLGAGAGIAASLGALTGGLLINHIPHFMGSAILSMLLLSGILRVLSGIIFLPFIHEVRPVRSIPAAELFHILIGGRSLHHPASHSRTHHRIHGYSIPNNVHLTQNSSIAPAPAPQPSPHNPSVDEHKDSSYP